MTNKPWWFTPFLYLFAIGTFVSPVFLSFGIKLGDAMVPVVCFLGWTVMLILKFDAEATKERNARFDELQQKIGQLEQQVADLELEQQTG